MWDIYYKSFFWTVRAVGGGRGLVEIDGGCGHGLCLWFWGSGDDDDAGWKVPMM